MNPIEIAKILKVNQRIGALLREGRLEMGVSIDELSNQYQVSKFEIERWESGFGTLQAALYGKIGSSFGEENFFKMNILINEIQAESKTLRGNESDHSVRPVNFDALGFVHCYSKVA